LGTMYSRKVDPLFAFYGNIVEQIKSLDGDSGELAKYYETRMATRQAWEKQPAVAIFEELKRFKGLEDAPAAIAYIDQMLATVQDEDLRWRLELARHYQLELSSGRKDGTQQLMRENALANARRLLSLSPPTDEIRERVLGHEAFMLQRMGRVDEMTDVYDRLIRDAANNTQKLLGLLRRKATALMSQPDKERKIAAYFDYRAATEPKSVAWIDATAMCAAMLESAGRNKEAIALHRQVIEVDPDRFGHFIGLARDQQAVGLLDDARKSLDEGEARMQASFDKNAGRSDRGMQKRHEAEIARLRKLLGPGN